MNVERLKMLKSKSDHKDFCGIILAGGKSSRMGFDKSSLTLNGRTFLEIQAEKLRLLDTADIIVSGKECTLPGIRYVMDQTPGLGPLGGLLSCFPSAEQKCALVLSVDVPLISVSTLSGLLEAHLSGDYEATILSHEDRIEPLIAVYNTDSTDLIRELADSKKPAMKAYIERLHYQLYPFHGNPEELLNCNFPRDLSFLFSIADSDRSSVPVPGSDS